MDPGRDGSRSHRIGDRRSGQKIPGMSGVAGVNLVHFQAGAAARPSVLFAGSVGVRVRGTEAGGQRAAPAGPRKRQVGDYHLARASARLGSFLHPGRGCVLQQRPQRSAGSISAVVLRAWCSRAPVDDRCAAAPGATGSSHRASASPLRPRRRQHKDESPTCCAPVSSGIARPVSPA